MIVALLSVLGALPLFSEEAAVPHWAFVEPRSPALPEVMLAGWPRNEIDHYILANLEREGLAPSPEAGRETPDTLHHDFLEAGISWMILMIPAGLQLRLAH